MIPNTPYKGQLLNAFLGLGLLAGFMLFQNQIVPGQTESQDLKKQFSQVSYRDPKLIEEHKAKLEALNRKTSA